MFVTDFEYDTSDYFILAFRLFLIGGICHNCCIVAVHDVSCRFYMLNNGCIHHKNYRCSVIIAAVGGYCFCLYRIGQYRIKKNIYIHLWLVHLIALILFASVGVLNVPAINASIRTCNKLKSTVV